MKGSDREKELSNGGKGSKVAHVRAKLCFQLFHEMRVPLAEMERHVGTYTLGVAKTVQSLVSQIESVKTKQRSRGHVPETMLLNAIGFVLL